MEDHTPMDVESRLRWDECPRVRDEMFAFTDIKKPPWYVVEATEPDRSLVAGPPTKSAEDFRSTEVVTGRAYQPGNPAALLPILLTLMNTVLRSDLVPSSTANGFGVAGTTAAPSDPAPARNPSAMDALQTGSKTAGVAASDVLEPSKGRTQSPAFAPFGASGTRPSAPSRDVASEKAPRKSPLDARIEALSTDAPPPADLKSLFESCGFRKLEHATGFDVIPAILKSGLVSDQRRSDQVGSGYGNALGIYFTLRASDEVVNPTMRYSHKTSFDPRTNQQKGDMRGAVIRVELSALDLAPFHVSDSWHFGRLDTPGRSAKSDDPVMLRKLLQRLAESDTGNNELVFVHPDNGRPVVIPPELFSRIEVVDREAREDLLGRLHAAGVSSAGGRSVEELVVAYKDG